MPGTNDAQFLQYIFKYCGHRISLESYIWKRTENPRASLLLKTTNLRAGRMRRLPDTHPVRIHVQIQPRVSTAAPATALKREVPDTGVPVLRDLPGRVTGLRARKVPTSIPLPVRGRTTSPVRVEAAEGTAEGRALLLDRAGDPVPVLRGHRPQDPLRHLSIRMQGMTL